MHSSRPHIRSNLAFPCSWITYAGRPHARVLALAAHLRSRYVHVATDDLNLEFLTHHTVVTWEREAVAAQREYSLDLVNIRYFRCEDPPLTLAMNTGYTWSLQAGFERPSEQLVASTLAASHVESSFFIAGAMPTDVLDVTIDGRVAKAGFATRLTSEYGPPIWTPLKSFNTRGGTACSTTRK